MNEESKRGGAREGAGRKKQNLPPVLMHRLRATPSEKAQLGALKSNPHQRCHTLLEFGNLVPLASVEEISPELSARIAADIGSLQLAIQKRVDLLEALEG